MSLSLIFVFQSLNDICTAHRSVSHYNKNCTVILSSPMYHDTKSFKPTLQTQFRMKVTVLCPVLRFFLLNELNQEKENKTGSLQPC